MIAIPSNILCFFGWHRPLPGQKRAWAIAWCCRSCGGVFPGALRR